MASEPISTHVSRATLARDASGPTLPDAIRELASHPGTSLRFLQSDGSEHAYSYADVEEEMRRRGENFLRLGLQKGDRVAFVVPDNEDFVLSFLGALSVGVVPVPMYPPLSMGKLDAYVDASARIIAASEAKLLLTDARVQSILWSLVDRVDTLEKVVTTEALTEPVSGEVPHVELGHDDLAFLQFTSGSTAAPKGVIVTHGSLLANLDGIMNVGLEISPDDVAVSWLPLYHDMGLIGFMLAPVWYGVPTNYIPTLHFVKHPKSWMEAMDRFRGTIAFAPNFAYALATRRTKASKVAEMDLSCVKVLGCGAEPNHPGTLQAFLDHFAPAGLRPEALLPCYGMAEATLAMTFVGLEEAMRVDRVAADRYHAEGIALPVDERADRDDSDDGDEETTLSFVCCGRPFPDHEIVIVDDEGRELAERRVGEIVFRGPSVTPGYYNEPDRTAETFRPDGLRTGDLGYLADGQLYVTGRKKDVIILNGRNYDPQTVEWAVAEIDGVRRGNVVAFSVPGARTEELIVVAEIRPGADEEALRGAVRSRVREELGLAPGDVVLVGRGELPKTSSGKLQRRKTREQYLDGTLGTEGVRTLGARGDGLTLARHVARSTISRARHGVRVSAEQGVRKTVKKTVEKTLSAGATLLLTRLIGLGDERSESTPGE